MRWFHATSLMLALLTTGCSDTSTTRTESTVETPGGKTTVETEKSVTKSGQDPPPANTAPNR